MENSKDLALPPSIVDLIKTRNKIIENWHKIKEAHDDNEGLINSVDIEFSHLSRSHDYPFRVEKQTHELDYCFWVYCLEKLDLTRAMTIFQKSKYLKSVENEKIPFTPLNVATLFQSAGDKFKENSLNSVRDIFNKLLSCTYYSNEHNFYKKDNLRKVEPLFRIGGSDLKIRDNKLVLERLDDKYDTFRFEDLYSICRLLEGLGASDYSNNLYSKVASVEKGCTKVETEYFEAQAFKNRNVKVKWKTEKLNVLDQINKIGAEGQMALQAELRKRYKREHFHNSGRLTVYELFGEVSKSPKYKISDIRDFNFYKTPEQYANEMANILKEQIDPLLKPAILEPSMGDGALIQALISRGLWNENCEGVEYNGDRFRHTCATIGTGSFNQADFLKWSSSKKFDAVVMNPPFHRGIEIHHIVKAWGHLKPGGYLISVFPGSDLDLDYPSKENKKKGIFLDWIADHRLIPDIKIPRGTFADTYVASSIITLKKEEV